MTDAEADINQAHREKMAKIKAVKDKIYASKTKEKGLLMVHTGTGKGKSTAAFGLVMRTLGPWVEGGRGAVREGASRDGRTSDAGSVFRSSDGQGHG